MKNCHSKYLLKAHLLSDQKYQHLSSAWLSTFQVNLCLNNKASLELLQKEKTSVFKNKKENNGFMLVSKALLEFLFRQ